MSKYVDLVVLESPIHGRNIIAKAPLETHIEKGQYVKIQNEKGQTATGTVISSLTWIEENEKIFDFIVKVANEKLPLSKVIAVIQEKEISYEDEEEAEN